MRLATWNINSVRTRCDRALALLERHSIDVLALQETKVQDDVFPRDAFEAAGYRVATHGSGQWNGVAIISRVGLEDVRDHIPRQPGFHRDDSAPQHRECRTIGARCNGVDVWSLYVPHGRAIDHRHYRYKLRFLAAVADYAAAITRRGSSPSKNCPSVFVGDFNVAPLDTDVWDRTIFDGQTHVTPAERQMFDALCAHAPEVTREFTQGQYTCWDYAQGRFFKNQGLCIDFQCATPSLRARSAFVDREERKGHGASDHAPVIVDYVMP